MASKSITDRLKSAELVLAMARAQTLALGGLVGASTLLEGLTARLAAARDGLVAADAAHESELADDQGPRDERDDAATRLRDRLVQLRALLVGLFGARPVQAIFGGDTPVDPVVLARFAEEVARRLAVAKLPSPRLPGVQLDQAGLAAELTALVQQLQGALEAVAREVREAQQTLAAKNTAIDAFDRVFAGTATTLSALLSLVGADELAAKVRPSARRAGQTDEQAETAAEEEATAPDGNR